MNQSKQTSHQQKKLVTIINDIINEMIIKLTENPKKRNITDYSKKLITGKVKRKTVKLNEIKYRKRKLRQLITTKSKILKLQAKFKLKSSIGEGANNTIKLPLLLQYSSILPIHSKGSKTNKMRKIKK